MAFRQPQPRPAQQRQVSYTAPARPDLQAVIQQQRLVDDSQEWVLFSPVQAPSITKTQTTSTEQTPRTAGLSRLSDFGSLETAVRSDDVGDDENETEHGSAEYEDGEELDSLDDGLRAFREPSIRGGLLRRLDESGQTVLPSHDGLGTFQASSGPVQEQLWQFERYNPRRRHRRQSTIERRLEAIDHVTEQDEADERRRRIENWRIEQSRALLDEIERETRRRRRMSMVSARRRSVDIIEEDAASLSRTTTQLSTGIEQEDVAETIPETESFWQRFTRRVMRDLIGLDEDLLSVIFGEALPEDAASPAESPSNPPAERDAHLETTNISTTTDPDIAWQHRLVKRLSKELGILVHQLSEHPGAFSTYLRAKEEPSYIGQPTDTTNTLDAALATSEHRERHDSLMSPNGAVFAPTLGQHHSASGLWDAHDPSATASASRRPEPARTATADEMLRLRREREYWERDLDVNTVFGYIRNRFSSRSPSPTQDAGPSSQPVSLFPSGQPPPTGTDANTLHLPSTANPMDASARRAAIIQHHHPLISRTETTQPQQPTNRPVERTGAQRQRLKRLGSSSCASQSTKKTKSASSRNYWDIGASNVGSGISAGGGGVGAWGDI